MSTDDDLEGELFGEPQTPGQIAFDRVMRGESRRKVAASLELTMPRFNDAMRKETDRRVGAAGSDREDMATTRAGLDAVIGTCWTQLALGSAYADPGPVLGVLVDAYRLRAQLGTKTTHHKEDSR